MQSTLALRFNSRRCDARHYRGGTTYEGSVISNEVQTALDLQKLSAKLGANILLTEDTLHAVKAMPGKYRRLGTVQLADDQPVIELYDLYEADPQPIRDLKHETQKQFEEADGCSKTVDSTTPEKVSSMLCAKIGRSGGEAVLLCL